MCNKYGDKLDKNGYRQSLLDTGDGICWYCNRRGDLARHEVFEGSGRRVKSKALGLWVNLCPTCHALCHEHPGDGIARLLKREGQMAAMSTYGWSVPDFIQEMGQNYLNWGN